MTAEEFDVILTDRMRKAREVLGTKAGEYATGGDRLANFKNSVSWFPLAADGAADDAAACCLGFMRKHWTSVADLVFDRASGRPVSSARIDEKVGDAINYLILLEALLRENAGG